MIRFATLLCALLATGAALAASAKPHPGVFGSDDRRPQLKADPFWNATGKIQIAGYNWIGSCTGVLVAPDLVITAAHCLNNPRMKKLVPPKSINFIAGLRKDYKAGHAKAACVALLGEALPAGDTHNRDEFLRDAALIVLAKPIQKAAPAKLAAADDIAPGATAVHAGYGRDRKFVLSVHSACKVLRQDGDLSVMDCDTNLGQSGGPVFVSENGTPKLAGIMVGIAAGEGSLMLGVKAWRKLVEARSCKAE